MCVASGKNQGFHAKLYRMRQLPLLSSPDRQLQVLFTLENGQLHAQLFRKVTALTRPARLGIVVNGTDRSAGLTQLELSAPTQVKAPLKRRYYASHTALTRISVTLTASDEKGPKLLLDVRVFDDGLGYRYRLPADEPGKKCHVDWEESSISVIDGTTFWVQDSPVAMTNCEGIWEAKSIGSVHAMRSGPVIAQLPGAGGYLAIAESGNFGLDWSGSKYELVGPRVRHVFAHDPKGFTVEAANIISPWRVVLAAPDLNRLVNAPVIEALAPDPDPKLFADTSWIRPGRVAWSWWQDDNTDRNSQIRFTDLAGEFGFEYNTLDGGYWSAARSGQSQWELIKEYVAYGKPKKVAQWVWTAQEGTRDPAGNFQKMREEFDRFAATGAVGLKIDFIDRDSQAARRWYSAALRCAAERKLMLNFHGANVPTGEEHTWPNEVSREGIYGLEQNKWTTIPAQHYAALPFTRYLVGHGDFTPGYFGHDPNRLKGTSWCLQLATAITYSNGLLHWVSIPEDMRPAFPQNSLERSVFTSIPVLWDETIVLPGAVIGELAPLARRNGKTWFVGVINGSKAGNYSFPLRFLGPGRWRMTVLEDLAEKPDGWQVSEAQVSSDRTLTVKLRSSGGFVARFTPA